MQINSTKIVTATIEVSLFTHLTDMHLIYLDFRGQCANQSAKSAFGLMLAFASKLESITYNFGISKKI